MATFFRNLFKKDADESPAVGDRAEDAVAAVFGAAADFPSLHDRLPPTSPMSTNSPFIAAGEHFTVRELSALLPPQLIREDATQGDQPVVLPLDTLKATLQQGRPGVRLSQIYTACPELFTREVTPHEDADVPLPFQKVKRLVEGGPASPFKTVSPRGDSPFAKSSPGLVSAAPSAPAFPFERASQASPFANPEGNGAMPSTPESPFARRESEPPEVLSPFSIATPDSPAEPHTAALSSPFHAAGTAKPPVPALNAMSRAVPSSPFSLANPSSGPSASPFPPVPAATDGGPFDAPSPRPASAPVPHGISPPSVAVAGDQPVATTPEPGAAVTELQIPLRAILRDVSCDTLGFDATAVPDSVSVALSLETVLPQLASGRVEIGLGELLKGIAERFRPAFARARGDLRLTVPLTEIFQGLPASAIPGPAAPLAPPLPAFPTPFSPKATVEQTPVSLPPLLQSSAGHAARSPTAPTPAAPPFPVPPVLPAAPEALSAHDPLPPLHGVSRAPLPFSLSMAMADATEPSVQEPATSAQGTAPGASASAVPNVLEMRTPPGRPSPFSRPPGVATTGQPPAAAPAVTLPPLLSLKPALESPAGADLPSPPAVTPAPSRALPPLRITTAPVVVPTLPCADLHADLGEPIAAESLQSAPPPMSTPPPVIAPPVIAPSAPSIPAAVPASAHPVADPPSFRAVTDDLRFGAPRDHRQLALRAIFMTAESLQVQDIADLAAELPGLRCCLIMSKDAVIRSRHSDAGEDLRHFAESAPRTRESLAALAESLGMTADGAFTLRADRGVRTFFIEDGHCLAVLHDEPAFLPGVREKLILVTRSLSEILTW